MIERFELTAAGFKRGAASDPSLNADQVLVEVAGCALGVEPAAEISGVVVAVGTGAGEWLGKRVVVPRLLCCGECEPCRRARPASCARRVVRKGLATHEVVPTRHLCAVDPPLWPPSWFVRPSSHEPEDDLWRLAALADAAAAPYGALARAGIGPSELLFIIGGGVRAAFAVQLARGRGAHVVVLEDREVLAVRALALGAILALPESLDPIQVHDRVADICRKKGAIVTATKVLETTGTSRGRSRALALTRGGETVAFLDGARTDEPPASIDWGPIVRGEITLLGATACHPDLIPELMALVVRGDLKLDGLLRAVRPGELIESDSDAILSILRP